ncbi:M23 family metallopeptidase [Stenotrophomonas sp. C3(2023)]|uniref:M23 family metallopeptidase n=1 Tax=Stenotrophomonas sp. C3(2023) TaxID=3080277 RepID=UPI00293C8A6C|nr:M23 family metallopeptidase [Stenotrophomonas sp. C3(2023)]MDV3469365.1 M23 family metallopeptidase [Stenotrophomonas sp. C3(2023)]
MRSVVLATALLLPCASSAAPGPAWRQGWGLARPPAEVAAPAPPARLRLRAHDGHWQAHVENTLYGPLQYALVPTDGQSVTGLPATGLLPARRGTVIADLPAPADGGPLRVVLRTAPGDPAAQPRHVTYALPFANAPVRVSQPPRGLASHRDAGNAEAVDFALPVGTPVLAARSGTVMQVQDGFAATASDAEGLLERVNLVRVLHEDGSMAVYAHLLAGAMQVRAGQHVSSGQPLGHSGNSGLSRGPHLHFAVQVNRGLQLHAVPVRMATAQGELRFARPAPDTGAAPDPAARQGPL